MSGTETVNLQNNAQVGVVGGYALTGQTSLVNSTTGQKVTPVTITSPGDPFAFLPPPTQGILIGKSHTSYDMNSKPANNMLLPGIYCGGLTIGNTNGTTFTMSPGTYIMAGGGFTVNSLGIVSGSGVTVYNTSSSGWGCSASSSYKPITISGQANVTLTAPSSGALAGVVFFGDRAGCSTAGNCQDQINAQSVTNLNGAMYFKSDTLVFSGTASNTGCMTVVADKININGNTPFAITGCTGTVGTVTESISPTTASLYTGQTQQFTATVSNASSSAVTWSVSGAGTINSSGLYTAPSIVTSQQTVTVTATSVAEPAVSASATVTLLPPVSVSVSPTSATLYGGQTQQFTASVANSTNTAVTWSISPASAGSISSSGLYTAPSTIATQESVTIAATSQADSTKSATATVNLNVPVVLSPTITTMSPSQGAIGTVVAIAGANFGATQGSSAVAFNGVAAIPTSWSDSQIVVPVPSGASSGNVVVTVNGLASGGVGFTILSSPSITSFSPLSGQIGTAVTIIGTSFGVSQGTSTLTFNGVSATPTNWSDTQIVVTVPAGATTGNIVVTVNGAGGTSSSTFTVTNVPMLASITPNSGAGGTQVTLLGTGFGATQGSSMVQFTGTGAGITLSNQQSGGAPALPALISSWSDTSITALVPTIAISGPVAVTVDNLTSNSVQFTVTGSLTVTSVIPPAASIGTQIQIDGSGFGSLQGASTITFNGTTSTPLFWSDTSIIVPVPVGATTGDLVVTVNGSQADAGSFSVVVDIPMVAAVTNSLGYQTNYTSSTIGGKSWVTSVDGPGCSTCTLRGPQQRTYDSSGNLSSVTDAVGSTKNYTYDPANNRTSVQKHVTFFPNYCSSVGQMLVKGAGAKRSAKGIHPNSLSGGGCIILYTYTYDALGDVLTSTDPLGNTTSNTYDASGNLLSTTTPSPDGQSAGSTTQFAYDGNGNLIQIIDPLGNLTKMTYNALDLLATVTDPQQNTTSYSYDMHGNRISTTDPQGNVTTYAYDAGDRLIATTYPDKSTAGFTYDYRGRRSSVTDQNGNKTTYSYDDADRLIAVTDAAGNTTQYTYDTEDNLTSITDANGHTTSYAYDGNGWMLSATYPSSLSETYIYDGIGNLLTKTDRNGNTTYYSYDALNMLAQKSFQDSSSVTYVNSVLGKLVYAFDSSGEYAFNYDNMGRLTGTQTVYSALSTQLFTSSYAYDAASNRISYTGPDGTTNTYTYDTLNRLTNQTSSAVGSFGFGYDSLGRRTSLSRPNGVTTNYQYDTLSHLLGISHGGTDGDQYTYDAASNRMSKQNLLTGITSNYSYDTIYELTRVISGSKGSNSYTYDAAGNRLSSALGAYSYNRSNELMSLAGNSYTYDSNGNMLTKVTSAGTNSYTWDYQNRLLSAMVPGANGSVSTVSIEYDPLGRRIQKTSPSGSTLYLYDGNNVVAQVDPSSGLITSSIMQGLGLDAPLATSVAGATYYYQQDGLGSVTSLTNGAGQVAASYVYDAFGNTLSSTGNIVNPYRFTGREWDSEIGLYYYRARYYDSAIGRFISEDPSQFTGGTNFYSYVKNNPIDRFDPWGLQTIVQIWNPVGHGESSFGHVSLDINGMVYTFGPSATGNGMLPVSEADYIAANENFRSGLGYILNLTPDQEKYLVQYLQNFKGTYNPFTRNCTAPVLKGLASVGVLLNLPDDPITGLPPLVATPQDIAEALNKSGNLVTGWVPYPQARP